MSESKVRIIKCDYFILLSYSCKLLVVIQIQSVYKGVAWKAKKEKSLVLLRALRIWQSWWWWCSLANSCLTLWPHGLQHFRLPCPLLSPRVYSNLWPFESVMLSNHLILCLSLLLPSVFPSIRIFSSDKVMIT